MMAVESLLFTSSSLLILFLQLLLFQTSLARPYNCTPSACGIFPNISSPFRLKGHPKHCGYVELACENNVTSFYLNSHKLYVKEINYSGMLTRMRVVVASVNNDTCSFPTSSAIMNPFHLYGSLVETGGYIPINFMSCPHPLKNSSLFTETTPCQTPNSRFTYIKVGSMMASEVQETCRVDVVAITSWRGFKDFLFGFDTDFINASLEEINSALLYGLDLYISPWHGITKWDKFTQKFQDYYIRVREPLFIILPFAVVFGAAISPVMAIVGFIVVLGFILSSPSYYFDGGILWSDTFDPLHTYDRYSGYRTFDPRRAVPRSTCQTCNVSRIFSYLLRNNFD